MTLVARASNTVRNKNIGMVLLCAAFLCWFAYDGFVRWPEANDGVVARLKGMMKENPPRFKTMYLPEFEAWKGWKQETPEARKRIDGIVDAEKIEGWHSTLDITVQRWIVVGLMVAVGASVWWFLHCQQRRARADETTVSPSPGVVIPWGKIKVVDNTRWKKAGIVDITYEDEKGEERKAKFDDYELEREPLIEILDVMGQKAQGAEFLPKEGEGEDK